MTCRRKGTGSTRRRISSGWRPKTSRSRVPADKDSATVGPWPTGDARAHAIRRRRDLPGHARGRRMVRTPGLPAGKCQRRATSGIGRTRPTTRSSPARPVPGRSCSSVSTHSCWGRSRVVQPARMHVVTPGRDFAPVSYRVDGVRRVLPAAERRDAHVLGHPVGEPTRSP